MRVSKNDIAKMVKESLSMILEHQDIINNFNTALWIIEQQWSGPDDFWFINIDSRRKDIINRQMEHPYYKKGNRLWRRLGGEDDSAANGNIVGYIIVKGNTLEEALNCIKNPTVMFNDWAKNLVGRDSFSSNDGNMKAIKDVCEHFFARAYLTLNKRSMSSTLDYLKSKGKNTDFSSPDFKMVAGKMKHGKEYFKDYPLGLVDNDIDDEGMRDKVYNYLKDNGINVLKNFPSHDGHHAIVDNPEKYYRMKMSQFNDRSMTNNKKSDSAVKIKQDGKLLLYSPCGHSYEFNDIIKEKKSNKMIDRNLLKEAVKNSIFEVILKELNFRGTMGSKGSLSEADLLDPKEVFKDSYKLMNAVKKSGKTINLEREFANDYGYKVWKNYVRSMLGELNFADAVNNKTNEPMVDTDTGENIQEPVLTGFKPQDVEHKYPKTARPFFKWLMGLRYSKKGTNIKIFKLDDENMLLGHFIHVDPNLVNNPIALSMLGMRYGMDFRKKMNELGTIPTDYFVASYISVASNIKLVRLCQALSDYNNVIFAITTDMSEMLERTGFFTDGEIHMVPYAGKLAEKRFFATSEAALQVAVLMHGSTEKRQKRRMNT